MPSWRRRPARPTSGCSRWRPGAMTPYFTDAERAALALTEALTRISDRADPVPDAIWNEAAKHYRRDGTRGAGPRDRQHQRLEPAQRRGAPANRGVEGLRRRLSGLSLRSASSRTSSRSAPLRLQRIVRNLSGQREAQLLVQSRRAALACGVEHQQRSVALHGQFVRPLASRPWRCRGRDGSGGSSSWRSRRGAAGWADNRAAG